jgi:hypothetical protein
MSETLKQNNIKIIKREGSHGGWHSEIDEQTYVFTVLRDPAEQTVSLYAHQICLNKLGHVKSKYDKSKLTKELFFYWLENKGLYPNFQTKHFLGDQFYFAKHHPKSLSYVDLSFDEELLETRKNKVNLFLNNNNINGRSLEIQRKIFLDLGVEADATFVPDEEPTDNPESKILYDKFTEEEKDFIRKYSSMDNYLYNNVVYF